MPAGHLVDLPDTRLHVVRRGHGPLDLIVLHGGPGLDHTEFGTWLDPLGDVATLHLVDQRGQGRSERVDPATLSVGGFAQDVVALARALELERYAVLGHSYGAFVALRHAVEGDARLAGSVISAGIPAARFMDVVEAGLEAFEPEELRASVAASWEREERVETEEEVAVLMADQLPFHFADPRDPRIAEVVAAMAQGRSAPEVLRWAATGPDDGELDLEDRLGEVAVPLLVLAGRHDRVTTLAASQAIAAGVQDAELILLESSAHFGFVEETAAYVGAVRAFLTRLD